jgi:hypothetical protein
MPIRLSIAILVSTMIPTFGADRAGAPRRLIEFGWDEPDTAFMRRHVAEMEKTPFDGCVFHAYTIDAQGKRGDFLWGCWSTKAFAEEQLLASLDDLKQTPFKRFTHNFLRFNTAPADVDWFDDHSAILVNCKLAAKFARDGKCAGILFDTEQYNHPLFNYGKQRDAKIKSWDEYAAQVRKRGREVMRAFQDGYPDVTIFLTFGYSLPWIETGGKPDKIAQANYGLLAPFLDGMVDAAQGNVRIVDGHELSYGYKDVSRFAKAYQTMSHDVGPIVADPQKYKKVFSFGFGVWMDDDWRKKGWDTKDFDKNFYPPDAFEKTVRTALQTSDEYVWIYTEKPKWWTEEGGPLDLPSEYEQALRRAAGK